MSLFLRAVPYVLTTGVIILGILALVKQWHEYKNARLRIAVVVIFTLVGMLNLVSLYRSNQEKRKAGEEISGLRGQVESANNAQRENTRIFMVSFNELSQKLNDLQTQVKTEALQEQVRTLKADLQANMRAMAPGPKAELVFSFAPILRPPLGQRVIPVKDVTLPLNPDGSVHVEFNILNPTDVDAVFVEVNVQICDQCRYATEPAELTRMAGLTEEERFLHIDNLLAREVYKTLSMEVIPPTSATTFQMGINYRCRSCVIPREYSMGTVHTYTFIAGRPGAGRPWQQSSRSQSLKTHLL